MFPYCNQHDTCSGSSAVVSVMSARRRVTLRDHNCSLPHYNYSSRRSHQLKCFFPLHQTYKPTHTERFYVIQDSSFKVRGGSFQQWGQRQSQTRLSQTDETLIAWNIFETHYIKQVQSFIKASIQCSLKRMLPFLFPPSNLYKAAVTSSMLFFFSLTARQMWHPTSLN